MDYLVYRSRASIEPGGPEARALRLSARRNNRRDGITGYLHHEDGLFAQYIEGPAASLAVLWDVLLADDRHMLVTPLAQGCVTERRFRDWDMAITEAATMPFRSWSDGRPFAAVAVPGDPARLMAFFDHGAAVLTAQGATG